MWPSGVPRERVGEDISNQEQPLPHTLRSLGRSKESININPQHLAPDKVHSAIAVILCACTRFNRHQNQ